jgi:hypothetical protein
LLPVVVVSTLLIFSFLVTIGLPPPCLTMSNS